MIKSLCLFQILKSTSQVIDEFCELSDSEDDISSFDRSSNSIIMIPEPDLQVPKENVQSLESLIKEKILPFSANRVDILTPISGKGLVIGNKKLDAHAVPLPIESVSSEDETVSDELLQPRTTDYKQLVVEAVPLFLEDIPLPEEALPASIADEKLVVEAVPLAIEDIPLPVGDLPLAVEDIPVTDQADTESKESVAYDQSCSAADTSLPDYFNLKPILQNVQTSKKKPQKTADKSNNKKSKDDTNETASKKIQGNTKEKQFKCPDCEACFGWKSHMERHHNSIHAKLKPFKCSECDFSAVEVAKLKRHMLTHSEEYPFKCDLCYFRCKQKENLVAHTKTVHDKEKKFYCSECDASFTQKHHLERHQKLVHENAFKCGQCTFSCTTEHKLKTHELMHKGESVFKCEWCDFACEHYSKFLRHQMCHKDERPFKCSSCDFSCSLVHNLKNHEKSCKNKSE